MNMHRHTVSTKKVYDDNKTFIILSDFFVDGFKRFGSCGDIELGNDKLLDLQIQEITKFNPTAEIVIVVGYEADSIIDRYPKLRIIENTSHVVSGRGESIRLALNAVINGNVFIVLGNSRFTAKDLNQLTNTNSISVNSKYEEKKEYKHIGVIHQDYKALSFAFKTGNVWNGIMHISGRTLEYLKDSITRKDKNLESYEVLGRVIGDDFLMVEQNHIQPVNYIEDIL